MITNETIDLGDGASTISFDILAYVTDADYSWSAEAILRRQSDQELFFVTDGGCSCNGFGDYITVADLVPIRTIEEALKLTTDRPNLERSIRDSESIYR